MKKPFIYGTAVTAENFTDREKERKHLRLNFENGMNTVLISPRRMGKTSLVNMVRKELSDAKEIKIVHMDIYDCRSEYDFLERFASAIIKQTAGKLDQLSETISSFLTRVVPKISISPSPDSDFSLSLGITPETHKPQEILNLAEQIALKQGVHIVVCIDEFQQIGEFPDSLNVQKRIRGVWQHHSNASYCMFGSKKHLMMKIFQNKRMPFYKFGDTLFLDKISEEDWVQYIKKQFGTKGKEISDELALRICRTVDCYSSYVQEFAWNVFVETEDRVTEENFTEAYKQLLYQNSALFQSRIESLTSYQMNFLKAICSGVHQDFGSKQIIDAYKLGTKSNIARLKTSLEDKELTETSKGITIITDPVFELWFKSEYVD